MALALIAAVLTGLVVADRKLADGFGRMPEPVFYGADGFGDDF